MGYKMDKVAKNFRKNLILFIIVSVFLKKIYINKHLVKEN